MKSISRLSKGHYLNRGAVFLLVAALIAGMAACNGGGPPPVVPIAPTLVSDWFGLDGIRNDLSGNYRLLNDLDSTTAGYEELASETANGDKGWEPIGALGGTFKGTFDGNGYVVEDLYIIRPDETHVGLFGYVGQGGLVQNIAVNATVVGGRNTGVLVGSNFKGTVRGTATGSVTGADSVGGLVGYVWWGTVINSSSSVAVSSAGPRRAGGLVGHNSRGGVITDSSYAGGEISGVYQVGGLVGLNAGEVRSCTGTGNVTGVSVVGGVAGVNLRWGALNGSKFTGYVNGQLHVSLASDQGTISSPLSIEAATDPSYIGGLVGWNEGEVDDCSADSAVFGTHGVGGLVGWNDGQGTLSEDYGDYLASLIGYEPVSGLSEDSLVGTIRNSHSTGSVTGGSYVGGLVGGNEGIVNSCYFAAGKLIGADSVGGLVGSGRGDLTNSFYAYSSVLINGENVVTAGALYDEDFYQWLDGNKTLDVDRRLSQEDGYYLIHEVSDLKQLLVFGQDGSLKFRLKSDLDLVNDRGFYIPYLAGEFDGNGYAISNLSFDSRSVSRVGLFGYLHHGAVISRLGAEMVNVTGSAYVGGLVGENGGGTVSDCYSTGSVYGEEDVGGLVGQTWQGTVINSWSSVDVTLHGEARRGGGLVGSNLVGGLLIFSEYRGGAVTGRYEIGGLVGFNAGEVLDCQGTGTVTGVVHVGGVVGRNLGTLTRSSFAGEVNQVPGNSGDTIPA